MKIEHVAIWVMDIEKIKTFYEKYFSTKAGPKYINEEKFFQSYFLKFSSGARLELMHRPDIGINEEKNLVQQLIGYSHLAISMGPEIAVNIITERIIDGGYECIDGPRRTGDGCYGSVVFDPEKNRIEITV